MPEANLTRFGPVNLGSGAEQNAISASFRAINGPANLVLWGDGQADVSVNINGQPVAITGTETPITLQPDNQIEVSVGAAVGELGLRITQITTAELGVLRQGYFGLNTTDIERQRALYETMGFIGEIYPAGPETSQTFAQSLGFEDNYLIHVSLHSLENPPTPPFVDTVQFREASYREEPPYAALNHLGMAYATYSTPNLDETYDYLKRNGVEFVSTPATAPDGERFVFMQDQDGAFLKLMQHDGEPANGTGAKLIRLANTNMNVSDMERSREFYRLVGFVDSVDRSQAGDGAFAEAHGFDRHIEFEGQDISLSAEADGATLQLRQWKTPYDSAPPYPPPVNHLGIDRINFYVADLTATVKTMNDLGFEQLGPIGGSKEIGIVFFFDPDGIKVQFAGPQTD